MGTPLLLPPGGGAAAADAAGGGTACLGGGHRSGMHAVERSVDRALRYLSPHRSATPTLQNEIGILVHAATDGSHRGLCLWILWTMGFEPRRLDPQVYAELVQQWRAFAQRGGTLSAAAAEGRLQNLVAADCTPALYTRYLTERRRIDHDERGAADHTLSMMGSLTHIDLARYVYHELRGTVCCASTAGRGLWYIYEPDKHRWSFDRDGPRVSGPPIPLPPVWGPATAHRVPSGAPRPADRAAERGADGRQRRAQRRSGAGPQARRPAPGSVAGSGGGRSGGGGRGSVPSFSTMVNFPAELDPQTVRRGTLTHLDATIGDIRHVQSIMRALGVFLHDSEFPGQLDVRHEHLLPFANGVLDLDELCLRPGQPEDMVMRGPSYPWVDYTPDNADVAYLERMLTTMFPDTEVRTFALRFGASLLRKRNRFKHFYIFTGDRTFRGCPPAAWRSADNTNGGKSLFLSFARTATRTHTAWSSGVPVNAAFESLFGLLPLAAITGRETDPSGHNDYLARTQGMAICVCHEPDSGTQQILPDRVKVRGARRGSDGPRSR